VRILSNLQVSRYADDLGKPDWLQEADDKFEWLNRELYLWPFTYHNEQTEGFWPIPPVLHPWGFSSHIPISIFSLLLNAQAKGFLSCPIVMTVRWANCYFTLITLSVNGSVRLTAKQWPFISSERAITPQCAHIYSCLLCSFRTFFLITTRGYDWSTLCPRINLKRCALSAPCVWEKRSSAKSNIFATNATPVAIWCCRQREMERHTY
jgi:hypothetical protein